MPEDEKIKKRMEAEGKVKVSNFREMVKTYYRDKYNKKGDFEFVTVNYEFYDKDYKVFNLDKGQYIHRPQKRKVKTLVPFFIDASSNIDLRMFSIDIPGIININNLISEISKLAPKEMTHITDEEIIEILDGEGYTDPFFDHYFYSIMEYPGFNLYAKPKTKGKGTR